MAGRIPPIHPGEVLKLDLMEPLDLSGRALSVILKIPANRITEIVAGKRAITADTALRLGRAFDVEADFWMRLQAKFDLETARDMGAAEYKSIRRVRSKLARKKMRGEKLSRAA
ncbi:MAG: HigA family addiction module antitoxin [Alphaproteobacteria bacterium]|nr:HigA family addiction module antitoxin [Alphaproteobacteria bacterium]